MQKEIKYKITFNDGSTMIITAPQDIQDITHIINTNQFIIIANKTIINTHQIYTIEDITNG